VSYPFRIYIGYDPAEAVAFHVLEHSLRKHASIPLAITPLSRNNLLPVFNRPRRDNESTEFSFSRFIVPFLSGYKGWSLYMDCDMLARADIAELAAKCNPVGAWYKAVYVVPHDYQTHATEKMCGQRNEPYPRKNWSSLMLFNNERCKRLTPEAVNEATGPYLHRLQWTTDEQIGVLPTEWNWLVDELPPNPAAKVLHFTLGGPYLPRYDGGEGSDEWWAAFGEMTYASSSGLCGNTHRVRELAHYQHTTRQLEVAGSTCD
jgi:hypothetical protein